jgi:hypothetical protein
MGGRGRFQGLEGQKAGKPGPFTPTSNDSVWPSADERTTRRQEFTLEEGVSLLDRFFT